MFMSSIANESILGREYLAWGGIFDGWSPYGIAWKMLERATPDYSTIIPKQDVHRLIRDGVYNCTFKIPGTRKEAFLLHQKGDLLITSDIELWIDGSFSPRDGSGGAASLITVNGIGTDEQTTNIRQISSSYEAELTAMQLGLTALLDQEYSNARIAIYSDSQGLVRQLAQIPFCYRKAEIPLLECAEKIHELTKTNQVYICWIPGHMQIGRNDEADELAKASLLLPPTESPCPRLSSYKLRVKREVSRTTESEIQNQVQPSHCSSSQ
jgi:ribonuclease HI